MLRKKIRPYLSFPMIILFSCNSRPSSNSVLQTPDRSNNTDTFIGRKEITNEISGSAYRKRAASYFVIRGGDTSRYSCIFSEAKDDRNVSMNLHIPYSGSGLSYG